MRTRLLGDRRVLGLLAVIVVVACSSVSALASSPRPVKVADNFFSVKHLVIGKGTKVNWKWTGFLNHNVAVRTGPSKFRSRTQARGSYSHVFTKPGTYFLYCTIHPSMKMTVIVR
jgi:plastocyanin